MKKITTGFLFVFSSLVSYGQWSLTGNSGTTDGTNFIGTTDNVPFNIRVNNQKSGRIDQVGGTTYFGYQAGNSNVTGEYTGNTGIGYQSLYSTVWGVENTAIGVYSLYSTTNGSSNTALGAFALRDNTTGHRNTAVGFLALKSSNGSNNIALGYASLYMNSGTYNTALGYNALTANSSGNYNSAVGNALTTNTTGSYNVALGHTALISNTTGSTNTAVGYNSGPNTTNLDNTTALGAGAVTTASNSIRVGDANVTSIGGQVSWSTLSDGRFKREIKEDVSGLEFIKSLRPVSYTLDNDAYQSHIGVGNNKNNSARLNSQRYTGFVAQEVESAVKKSGLAFSGVESPKNDKDTYSIRYSDFVVPLVKAVQELTQMVEKQQAEIALLKAGKSSDNLSSLKDEDNGIVLYQNYPNPFRVDSEIKMYVPQAVKEATLFIYDMQGKPINSIKVKERGATSVKIEGGTLSPGLYLYTVIAEGAAAQVMKMILTE